MKTSRGWVLAVLAVIAVLAAAAAPAQADGRVHLRPSVRVYWGPGWGWWGPSWYYGPQYGYGGYPRVYPNATYGNLGALDTDISPERAEVWVDGKRVGYADDFDGYPGFLWLEKGTYDVVFYLPGFRTLARQYTIYPGLIIDVEDRLENGESVHPAELGPRTTERRDARLRAEQEVRAEAERRERDARYEPADDAATWGAPADAESLDARAEPGRLLLRVVPEDASVYLDGRFLGTGLELAALRSGLLVDAGTHQLEIVRPGHAGEARTLEIESGEEIELELELEPLAD